jgi:cytochrome P450
VISGTPITVLTSDRLFQHDPDVHQDPEQFLPQRFLGDAPEQHPEKDGQFGYGRRICPGKSLADQSGWLMIAQILSSLDIRHQKDSQGRDVEVLVEGIMGGIQHPKPFVMDLQPRSEKHAAMLEDIENELDWAEGDAEELRAMGILREY